MKKSAGKFVKELMPDSGFLRGGSLENNKSLQQRDTHPHLRLIREQPRSPAASSR
jgi:hypothetical protein